MSKQAEYCPCCGRDWADTPEQPATPKPTARQVGGDHYKSLPIQPVTYIHANGLGFIEGCIVKYVTRHKHKGGKVDLEKARHFIGLLIEHEYEGKSG